MTTNLNKYRIFCALEPSIPLFSQAWWLDVTAGDGHWDVALVEVGGEIVASMPYVKRARYGLTILSQPAMTQSLGPWVRDKGGKSATKLAREKELMEALIAQLPRFHHYSQNWSWRNTNWLPFYWAGFQQTTRYTYILQNLSDQEVLWKGLRENIRTDIRKASSRFNLRVRHDLSIGDFLPLNAMTFGRQRLAVPYAEQFLRNLDDACKENDCRRILIAEDQQGRRHAGVYIAWDTESAYYLMGGGDPELRNSGATSLCMWEAIKFAAGVTRRFDFEGSMLEPVERFFRAFGAAQTPYFSISKTPSRLLRAVHSLRELRGR